jgi:cysteine desulfurase
MREIYADWAATAPPAPEVVEAMLPYLGARFGNPSSVHRRGEAARDAVEHARAQVAALAGVLPEEVVFTASGSEANNLALKGALANAAPGRTRLVVSAIEHPSVLETARALAARGVPLTVVPVTPDGVLDLGALAAALGDDVALLSLMAVNNEVGTVQPVAEASALARARGARVHVDAVQAAGRRPLAPLTEAADLLTLAGHKLGGPAGAAALVVRRRTRVVPLVHGGQQERGRRAGTEDLAAIVGFGVAAERAAASLAAGGPERVESLGHRLASGLLAAVPGARLNGAAAPRLGRIVNLCVAGLDGEALLHELDHAGVTISTGSACSAAAAGPSHVLVAMGLRPEDAHASVRFSLGEGNDDSDVDHILGLTPPAVQRLRALAGPEVRHSA